MNLARYKSIRLLRDLSPAELQALDKIFKEKKARKGETVIRASDASDSMMFLLSGRLRVSLTGTDGKEFVLSHLEAGEFVGEISLITGEDRSADVAAIEPSILLILSKEGFESHCREYSGLSHSLLRELALRLRKASLKLGELALLDVYRRVAATLRGLGTEIVVQGKKAFEIHPRPTHQELSSMVGTSREMVTRALKGLEEDGHIVIHGKKIQIFSLPL
ncbi:MAG: Crp/Fnr family transcriptional regulator [Bdellovibrionales bacterium]|nr:Crp/Fnr family transcriptional regulator [Bdellovibrionales bacterium]